MDIIDFIKDYKRAFRTQCFTHTIVNLYTSIFLHSTAEISILHTSKNCAPYLTYISTMTYILVFYVLQKIVHRILHTLAQ